MKVSWQKLKSFTDQRNLSVQFEDFGDYYSIEAVDGGIIRECRITKSVPTGDDQTDFETNYAPYGNLSPNSNVTTQFELNNKDLKLCHVMKTVSATVGVPGVMGTARGSIKVPGTFGVKGSGRYVAGGYGLVDSFDKDDYIKVYVEDTDRKIALLLAKMGDPLADTPLSDAVVQSLGDIPGFGSFPMYPFVKSYTDDEVAEVNQGWSTWPLSQGSSGPPYGEVEVEPIGGYGFIYGELYLIVELVRPNKSTGWARFDIWWGKLE